MHAEVAEMLNLRTGRLVHPPRAEAITNSVGMRAADLNRDGYLDVIGTSNDYLPNFAQGSRLLADLPLPTRAAHRDRLRPTVQEWPGTDPPAHRHLPQQLNDQASRAYGPTALPSAIAYEPHFCACRVAHHAIRRPARQRGGATVLRATRAGHRRQRALAGPERGAATLPPPALDACHPRSPLRRGEWRRRLWVPVALTGAPPRDGQGVEDVHARSTTVQARPDAIDTGIAHLRDNVMPELMDLDGCIGLSLIVDRGSGRCIATSAWETREALRAAEQPVESIRRDAAEKFGGSVEKVERWEIAVLHREHRAAEGSGTRCTWLQLPDVDRGIDAFKTQVLPPVEEMAGFCSASFFVDRQSSRAVSAIAWESQEALDASRDSMTQLRATVTEQLGAQVIEVAEFELALAHLRVPELA
jgi:quinol monooxygenase YgiN